MADPFPNRPDFRLPFPKGTTIHLQTWLGHDPDDKKIDMYREGMKIGSEILASAAGVVHEHFDPGGIEIRHGNGWFTVYLHMSKRIPKGSEVRRGDWVGVMGDVGNVFPHLHYEQLFVSGAALALNADTGNMVNAIIEGQGPLIMDPANPIVMKSTNTRAAPPSGKTGPGGQPPRPTKFWVDTFADAPVFASPNDIRQTGTLRRGTNYVFGKARGREIRVGPAFNHFWLKTDPDVGHGQWVSAFYLSKWGNDQAKDNDGKIIPDA